jgi:hypothetical protein
MHRIICEAFHGPAKTPTETVDHKDCNRANNCSENLRWLEPKDQAFNNTFSETSVERFLELDMKLNRVIHQQI